jgi:GT2 family glycosyltransferase
VIRTALVRAVGGFRKGFEGSQDHDLILRCTERLAPGQIHHVPKVLYHWRAIEGSTALVREAKDYASAAGVRAVADHLLRTGRDAETEELPHGHYRVRWRLPQGAPKVSIIIPTRDRVELLRVCVQSIRKITQYPDYEIVIVDNQSAEPETLAYLDTLRHESGIRVLPYDAPFNYSAINNRAASQCSGALLCLLNNDIEVIRPDWLSEMVGQALRPEVGAVGAMLYYPDGTIQHAGVILGVGGVANHAFLGQPAGSPGHGARALVTQDLSAVTGACMVMRRDVYERVGGLDEQLRVAFNDIDFCLRVQQAGYRVVWTPFAELCHHESASRGNDDTPEKRQRFVNEVEFMQQRWGEELLHDPAYNPNLSLESPNFDLAFPPRHGR